MLKVVQLRIMSFFFKRPNTSFSAHFLNLSTIIMPIVCLHVAIYLFLGTISSILNTW